MMRAVRAEHLRASSRHGIHKLKTSFGRALLDARSWRDAGKRTGRRGPPPPNRVGRARSLPPRRAGPPEHCRRRPPALRASRAGHRPAAIFGHGSSRRRRRRPDHRAGRGSDLQTGLGRQAGDGAPACARSAPNTDSRRRMVDGHSRRSTGRSPADPYLGPRPLYHYQPPALARELNHSASSVPRPRRRAKSRGIRRLVPAIGHGLRHDRLTRRPGPARAWNDEARQLKDPGRS